MTIEEMCRRLLCQAMRDDLVTIPGYESEYMIIEEYTAQLSAGELTGVANLLQQFINESFKHE